MNSFKNINIPWADWKIVNELGEGYYGKVYEIERTQYGITERDALKIIRIPKNRKQYDEAAYSLASEDEESIKEFFSEKKDKLINEVRGVKKLKATENIVGIKDWSVSKLDDGYSWEICIRMAVLTPLVQYVKKNKGMEEAEVIKLGEDICRALVECEKEKIVHRDIKPDNIMVSGSGKFKLGDFGIARHLEDDTTMTGAGTKPYMAPEIANGGKANKTVDLYSLGVVLYEMLNNCRPPFIKEKGRYSATEKESAIQRRLRGEELPEPANGSDALKKIVLKACEPDPAKRYRTAAAMLKALEDLKIKEYRDEEIPAAHNKEYRQVTWPDGTMYEGECMGEKKHGYGKLTWPSGKMYYKGEWKDDMRHGQGKMFYADGRIYEGEWLYGKKNGYGRLTWADGAIYEGEWKDDKYHGQGTMTYADGHIYEGEWLYGKKNGYGKSTWADGTIYEGEWKDDRYHGQGTMTYADGRIYEGEWLCGEKNGYGKSTWADGAIYEGEWKDDKYQGHGTMTYAYGAGYEGEWLYGKKHGYGKYTYVDGRVYEGEWKNGKRNGYGTEKEGDCIRSGNFINDKKEGPFSVQNPSTASEKYIVYYKNNKAVMVPSEEKPQKKENPDVKSPWATTDRSRTMSYIDMLQVWTGVDAVNIKVIGVGGGGCNAINRIAPGLQGVTFIGVNTDRNALAKCRAEFKILIGENVAGGRSTRANPEIGQRAAEESIDEIISHIQYADLVFITAGMGGGVGTGAAPIIAKAAKDCGAYTVGIVTKPFTFEGKKRWDKAEKGIQDLSDNVDSMVIIPNDRLIDASGKNTSMLEAFAMLDDFIAQYINEYVRGVEAGTVIVNDERRPAPANETTMFDDLIPALEEDIKKAIKFIEKSKSDKSEKRGASIKTSADSMMTEPTAEKTREVIAQFEEYVKSFELAAGIIHDEPRFDKPEPDRQVSYEPKFELPEFLKKAGEKPAPAPTPAENEDEIEALRKKLMELTGTEIKFDEPIFEEPKYEDPMFSEPSEWDYDFKDDVENQYLDLDTARETTGVDETASAEAEDTKKIDEFYTLYRKNEEFQKLLDEEYEKLKGK